MLRTSTSLGHAIPIGELPMRRSYREALFLRT